MHISLDDCEYKNIVDDILEHREFKKIEGYKHHSVTRLEHSLRVSFYSYKICRRLNFDFVSAARGGLLHDFFINTYKKSSKKELLLYHPLFALYNSMKHFELNDVEKNIIKSHMFPVNIKYKPKYKESYVILVIDKIACLYERYIGCKYKIQFNLQRIIICTLIILMN